MASGGGFGPMLYNSGNSTSSCAAPHKFQWVNQDFGECVLNNLQLTGFILGLVSNLCWLVAQSPQLYLNWKNGSAEGLSLLFLADWLLGDITNLIGCLLTNQVQTQLFTAVYFCFIDSLMVLQWLYYNKLSNAAKRHAINSMLVPIVMMASPMLLMSVATAWSPTSDGISSPDALLAAPHRGGSRALLALQGSNSTGGNGYSWETHNGLVGYVFGWVSGMLYFTSRLPQIWKNFKRRSCEGLSPIMFAMAVTGNGFYACGVLMISVEPVFIVNHLPWLIGSIGTLFFDFTILVQYVIYGEGEAKAEGAVYESDPLLGREKPATTA